MLNIPTDYKPYKLNCIAGDAVVGILCRRPDGGVSDWHATMNKKAVNGVCPISGKPMKEVRTGVFVRKTGDITVVMTNSAATRAHLNGASRKVIEVKSKPIAYTFAKRKVRPRKNTTEKRNTAPTVSDVQEAMAQALKEAKL